MRYNTYINNVKASEWGLNIQQAYLFAWFYELPSWAEKVTIGKETFYFAAKNKAVKELPILTEKLDTMYRYYKQIQELGLIEIMKIEGKDYISITAKGKTWNGTKSEHSEINPNEVGNKSETTSEINPTYNITSKDNSTNDNIYSEKEFLEDWGLCRKSYRNLPTNIKGLKAFDNLIFKRLKKDYGREEFRQAMRGLFEQEVIKYTAMITQPTHFLENMEKYYNAFISKDFKQYGSKQVQH